METKTIYTKLLDFQKKVDVIKKDAKNPFFKNTYASLGNIISEVKPLLNGLGLVLMQPIENGSVFTTITDSQSGEQVICGIPLPQGVKPQDLGSAISYYRRYTLTSLLALELDEDDDGNKATKPDVKAMDAPPAKMWLNPNTPAWDNAVAKMKIGTITLDDVKSKCAITKINEELFMHQVNSKTK